MLQEIFRVTGNLLVEGPSASIDVSNLRVEDKQIELAITSDSTPNRC